MVYGGVPEWPKGADCKSVASCFGGSNPPPSTKNPYTKVCGFLLITYSLFTIPSIITIQICFFMIQS